MLLRIQSCLEDLRDVREELLDLPFDAPNVDALLAPMPKVAGRIQQGLVNLAVLGNAFMVTRTLINCGGHEMDGVRTADRAHQDFVLDVLREAFVCRVLCNCSLGDGVGCPCGGLGGRGVLVLISRVDAMKAPLNASSPVGTSNKSRQCAQTIHADSAGGR